MNYTKPALSISDQILLLKKRGLIIKSDKKAEYYLTNINYYRLSAYLLSFQKYGDTNHDYMPWATLERVVRLYHFDRELRFICMDAIERIEVALRSKIVFEYSIRHGANWYEDPKYYIKVDGYNKTLKKINEELNRTKEVFIQHYNGKYTNPKNPPAWMTLEVLSFGQLSIMFKNLIANDAKKAIAAHFGVSYTILESWIEHLAYIRNICAHHSRLWNRTLTIGPTLPKKPIYNWIKINPSKPDKIYSSLCIMAYLLDRCSHTSPFSGQIKTLLHKFPQIDINAAGFTKDWKNDKFWSRRGIIITHRMRITYFFCRNLVSSYTPG